MSPAKIWKTVQDAIWVLTCVNPRNHLGATWQIRLNYPCSAAMLAVAPVTYELHYYIHLTDFFQDNMGKPEPERQNHSGF